MTRTNKTLKGLLTLLVSMTVALGASLFAFAAEPVTETVVVTQVITENTTPQRTNYTYTLTPKKAENPMPDGTKDGKYTVGPINGATDDKTAPTFTLTIDKSQPGVYEYILEKAETTPEGDTLSPEKHIFGYKVEVDEKAGELVVIPYICQSGNPIFSEPDANGYPTKLTLPNVITGKKNQDGQNGQNGKDGQDGKDGANGQNGTDGKNGTDGQNGSNGTDGKNGTNGTSGKNGTNGTNGRNGTNGTNGTNVVSRTVARAVNTGDPMQLGLWVGILTISAGAILFVIMRRRKDDEEEN